MKLAIATICWARNEEEKKVILATLNELDKLGFPVVVTDQADSEFPLVNEVKKLRNCRVFTEKSLDSKTKNSFVKAAQLGDLIFYTESDKFGFAKSHAKSFIAKALKNPKGITLASRSPKTFSKLPRYQRAMEKFLSITFASLNNKSWNEDISYGPRMIPSSLVKYFDHLYEEIGFGWQGYLLTIAVRLKMPIKIIKFNVFSPPDVQKGKEIVLFRMKQAIDYFKGYEKGMKVPL